MVPNPSFGRPSTITDRAIIEVVNRLKMYPVGTYELQNMADY